MSLTIRYKLNADEQREFQKFCDALRGTGTEDFLAMDRNEIAKRSLFYAISDANARAAKMQADFQKAQRELAEEQLLKPNPYPEEPTDVASDTTNSEANSVGLDSLSDSGSSVARTVPEGSTTNEGAE
jgi:hypothetical protein